MPIIAAILSIQATPHARLTETGRSLRQSAGNFSLLIKSGISRRQSLPHAS